VRTFIFPCNPRVVEWRALIHEDNCARAGNFKSEEHSIYDEPNYESAGSEVEIFDAAYRNQLPVLLKGPVGCGKRRFVEHMASRHDVLTASQPGEALLGHSTRIVSARNFYHH